MVGLAGSVVVGARALLGAAAGVADHLTIGADATVGASAGVGSNVPAGALVSGTPAIAHSTMMERYMNIARLRMLYPRVDDLKKRVEALEKGEQGA
jgi:UDP-3-O-[3-hydroxymyristoyl] glucosamine N-acyltransferase